MTNKRTYHRLPIIKNIAEPISMSMETGIVSGVILNLSASGILLLAYANIKVGKQVHMAINIPNIHTKEIMGRVVRNIQKSDMWEIAIEFTEIDTLDSKHINRIAIDFNDCENKIALGASDVCRKECSYYSLCNKKQKK